MNSILHNSPRRITALSGICLLSGLCLCSCSTSPVPVPADHTAAVVQSPGTDWVMVRPKPPTWYPRGVPADCPTDYQSGYWVHTEDACDTRYFLPAQGLTKERRASLLREALAARSPEKKNRIAREDAARVAKGIGTALFYLTPPGWLVAMTKMPAGSGSIGSMGGWSGSPSIKSISCPTLSGACLGGGLAGVGGCPGGGAP